MATGISDSHGAEFLAQPRAAWMQHAACKGQDVDMFFVGAGEAIWDAVAFCSRCTVRKDCLQYAIDNDLHTGVWGGLSPRARRDPHRRHQDVQIPTRDKVIELRARGYSKRAIALELAISDQQVWACLERYRKARHG